MFHLEHGSCTSEKVTKSVPPGTWFVHFGKGHERCSTWNTVRALRKRSRKVFHLEHGSCTHGVSALKDYFFNSGEVALNTLKLNPSDVTAPPATV